MLSKFEPTMSQIDYKPCVATPCHPIFRKIREEFYNEEEQRKAYVPLEYIYPLDALGLLIWYLDDGWFSSSPYIGSVLFEYDNLSDIIDIINENLNLTLTLTRQKNREEFKVIKFFVENRDKLMPVWWELIHKYNIPKCMWYKMKRAS